MSLIPQLNSDFNSQLDTGDTCMSGDVTGIAFKALYDAVLHQVGEAQAERFLRESGLNINDIGVENSMIEVSTYYKAWKVAETITGDPLLGFHIGSNFHPSDLGIMGYVIQNCKDIQQAMMLIIKTNPFGNKTVSNDIHIENNSVVIRFRTQLDPEIPRHWVEMNIAAYLRMYHLLTDNKYINTHTLGSLSFAHSCPVNVQEINDYFNCDIKFDQPVTEFSFALEHFSKPIFKGNKNILDNFMSQLGISLEDDDFILDVKKYIKRGLPHVGVPTLLRVAKHFNISESTAKRRFLEKGYTYVELCQNLQEKIAKDMLKNQQVSLTEVACYLGYSAPSALSRSFKNWTGQTIKEYRNSLKISQH
ncbi:MAG: AraC family transcriptional regulator ligand-binding domain-containing protein [Oleispira sp.]